MYSVRADEGHVLHRHFHSFKANLFWYLCVHCNVNPPSLIFPWCPACFPEKLFRGGNWILWIIMYPWWVLFGFVVVTGLPGPCTSVYESCIKRTLQDTAKQKAQCLHMDITAHLIDGSRPRWSPFAWCQTLDHIRDVRLKMKRNIH